MTRLTDEELEEERRMIEAAQVDREAFGVLYERYVDRIYAYVHTLTRNRELAEDITASTFAKAIEDLPRFQWRGVPYSAWLYRVAANLVHRTGRRPPTSDIDEHQLAARGSPEDIVEQRLRDAEVRAAVASLPTEQRQVVLLRFGGDLANREIAALMERSEGAVKLLTFRAMTRLRTTLGAPQPSERVPGRRR